MILNNKVLFIHPTQFGYHTNAYKYCYYLRDKFDITFVCNDTGQEKITLKGINVIYAPNIEIRSISIIFFILTALFQVSIHKGKIFVFYFKWAAIIKKIFFRKKMILDIRSLAVVGTEKSRKKFDAKLIRTTKIFDCITIISEGLRKKIGVKKNKSIILPLGADHISINKKRYDELKLLYIGTLNNRDIHKTIEGLKIFRDLYPKKPITYDIIGSGFGSEVEELKSLVNYYGLEESIFIHGNIPHVKLKPYFDNCNIGVSFIPLKDYYQYQPPTKTFEYILSGLFTIATSTKSNKEVIKNINGILIKDSALSFANSLHFCYENRKIMDSSLIRQSLINYRWINIIKTRLIPLLSNKTAD